MTTKYRVCLARDTCEYGYIEVEADSFDEAVDKAITNDHKIEDWQESDWAGRAYYPGAGNCERLEDGETDEGDDAISGGYF